jgi:hypothetical protein
MADSLLVNMTENTSPAAGDWFYSVPGVGGTEYKVQGQNIAKALPVFGASGTQVGGYLAVMNLEEGKYTAGAPGDPLVPRRDRVEDKRLGLPGRVVLELVARPDLAPPQEQVERILDLARRVELDVIRQAASEIGDAPERRPADQGRRRDDQSPLRNRPLHGVTWRPNLDRDHG